MKSVTQVAATPPFFVGRDSRESFSHDNFRIHLIQDMKQLPTGGATVRRLTLSENRSCYEAEAPRFSVWVLSQDYSHKDRLLGKATDGCGGQNGIFSIRRNGFRNLTPLLRCRTSQQHVR